MFFVDFHTHHLPTTNDVLAIINLPLKQTELPEGYNCFSFGIHPWDTSGDNIKTINQLKHMLELGRITAIGECGLDKRKGANADIQIKVFKQQIELSEQWSKPLIIHCVKAYSEIIKLRKDLKPSQPWILHGFNSSVKTMQQALNAGFYLSFGPQTNNTQSKALKSFLQTPPNRLLLETDDTGQNIKDWYTQAARLRGVSTKWLIELQNDHFNTLFAKDSKASIQ